MKKRIQIPVPEPSPEDIYRETMIEEKKQATEKEIKNGSEHPSVV